MPRKTSKAEPGRWYVCSGEGEIPLANGPDTYIVTSSKVSTIMVEVYDSYDPKMKNVKPGQSVEITVKSGLFLRPKPPDSGTAEGEYASSS
jgi:hypothetical protein